MLSVSLGVLAGRNSAWSAGTDPGHVARAWQQLRRCTAGFLHDLHPGFLALLCVFVLVDNFLFCHMEDAALRDGQAADIASGISQEVPFRHLPGDVYVPLAVHLSKDEIVELLRQR